MYYTIPLLAQKLNQSRQWIWKLVSKGVLPATKVGGVFIVRFQDLPETMKNKLNNFKPILKEKNK